MFDQVLPDLRVGLLKKLLNRALARKLALRERHRADDAEHVARGVALNRRPQVLEEVAEGEKELMEREPPFPVFGDRGERRAVRETLDCEGCDGLFQKL